MESYELQHVLAPGAFGQMTVPVPLAANMLGIDPFAVGWLIADGELECVREGRYRFIPLPSLFAYRRRGPARRAGPGRRGRPRRHHGAGRRRRPARRIGPGLHSQDGSHRSRIVEDLQV
jgi:hypothetical protein